MTSNPSRWALRFDLSVSGSSSRGDSPRRVKEHGVTSSVEQDAQARNDQKTFACFWFAFAERQPDRRPQIEKLRNAPGVSRKEKPGGKRFFVLGVKHAK